MNNKNISPEAKLASIRQDYLITLKHIYFDDLVYYLGVLIGKIFFARFIYTKIFLYMAQMGKYDIRKGRLCGMEQRLDFGMKNELSLMDFVESFPISPTRIHNYYVNILDAIGVTFLEDELLSLVEDVEKALSFDRRMITFFSKDIIDLANKYKYESVCTPVPGVALPMEKARNEPFLYRENEYLSCCRDEELLVFTSNCRICGNSDGIVRVQKTLYSFSNNVLLVCRRDEVNRYISVFVKQCPFVGLIEEVRYTDDAIMLILRPWQYRYILSDDGKCEIPNKYITFKLSAPLEEHYCDRKIEDRYCFSLDVTDYNSFSEKPTDDISITDIPSLREGYLNAVLAAVNEDGRVELKYFQNWKKVKDWKRQPVAVIKVSGFEKKDYEKNILTVISGLPLLAESDWRTVSYWIRRIILPSQNEMATRDAAYIFLCECIDSVFERSAALRMKDELCRYVTAGSMAAAIKKFEDKCTPELKTDIIAWLRSHHRSDGRQLSVKSPVYTLCILASDSMSHEHHISSAKNRLYSGV